MVNKNPLYIGTYIKRLRVARNMTQADLAHQLGISASYLNLIENHKRRVSLALLVSLSQIFLVKLDDWFNDADHHLYQNILQVFADDLFMDDDITTFDVRDFVSQSPNIANAINKLYLAYQALGHRNDMQAHSDDNQNNELQKTMSQAEHVSYAMSYNAVINYLKQHHNYFPELEAESLRLLSFIKGERPRNSALITYLYEHHGINYIEEETQLEQSFIRNIDMKRRVFRVSSYVNAATKHFQLAYAVASVGGDNVIRQILERDDITNDYFKKLLQINLTNYLAAAILMPYDDFFDSARETRYDIELLMMRYRTSFEQVCQRFTTLNNPSKKGVPFHFIRVDRAGNISKRFSLSQLSIPRYGAICPRWNIFESFTHPSEIIVGTAILPSGASFLTIASSIQKGERGHSNKRSMVAIGIGCDIQYASQLVYSDRLNLDNYNEFNPIGTTCSMCERINCADRIAAYHNQGQIDPYKRGISLYQ